MPRVMMLETYTCGDGTWRRGKDYDVTDARARMLIGRGSARLHQADKPPVTETATDDPADPPGDPEPAVPTEGGDVAPAPKPGKARPAPKPKA